MAADHSETFNQRLSQWVANQGFWFQVRYSMASGGSRGVVLVHLLRFLTRLAVLLAVLGLIGVVYLMRLPGTKGFKDGLQTSINDGLGAVQSKMSGFQHQQGELIIQRFVSEGGKGDNQSFFSKLTARNIRGRMGFFNALPGKWRLGTLTVGDLDIQLNAGADDAKGARRIAEILFRQFETVEFDSIDIGRASVRWGWGFSELTPGGVKADSHLQNQLEPAVPRNWGVIADSQLQFQRVPQGWRLHASGGQFSQGWLKRLEIVELIAVCSPEGIVFEKAEFRKGSGSVRMDGLKVVGGERPEVKGVVRVSRLPLEDQLPPAAREFIDGFITGDFTVSGSTNPKEGEGLALEGDVTLDEENPIRLRDRIYLLGALTQFAVSPLSFKKVEFTQGSFHMKTKDGSMELTKVDLKAGDLMTLTGQMQARLPTREEAAAALQRQGGDKANDHNLTMGSADAGGSDPNFSLKRAAIEAQRAKEKSTADSKDDEGSAFFEKIGQSFEARMLAEQALEIETRTLFYEGTLRISLPPETFKNTPTLRDLFPPDPQTGRIPMDVPLKGDIYSLTFDQTEDLWSRSKKYQ